MIIGIRQGNENNNLSVQIKKSTRKRNFVMKINRASASLTRNTDGSVVIEDKKENGRTSKT